MSNILKVTGKPERERKIRDMLIGETGYTVPWAVQDGELNESFPIKPDKFGTRSLRVECVGKRQFHITYDEPVYRNPLREWVKDLSLKELRR